MRRCFLGPVFHPSIIHSVSIQAREADVWVPMLGCTVKLLTMVCMQYDDNVVGPGSPKYDDAYFEINYVRAYTTGGPTPTQSSLSYWVYANRSSTAMRHPAPTSVFSGAMTSSNGSPNAVASRVDVAMGYQLSLVEGIWP